MSDDVGWNPLYDELRRCGGDPGPHGRARRELRRKYAFGVPDADALDALVAAAPIGGVVEVGAGLGYWARLLANRGVDVEAYDLHPPPSPQNQNFPGVQPWHPIEAGDETAVDRHGDRMLLLVWPTADEDWPAEALVRFHRAGGQVVAYVGGDVGGPTGDDRFHRLLGMLDVCHACSFGAANASCVCHVTPMWDLTREQAVPHWQGHDDALRIYRRRRPDAPFRLRGRIGRRRTSPT